MATTNEPSTEVTSSTDSDPPPSTLFRRPTTTRVFMDLTNYYIINSPSELSHLDSRVSSISWTPCAIAAFSYNSATEIKQDPYINTLARLFLETHVICSRFLCRNIPYCHPLWLALDLSNFIKSTAEHAAYYSNTYIHPIFPYNSEIHAQQHSSLDN
jgi:hypothetical protein